MYLKKEKKRKKKRIPREQYIIIASSTGPHQQSTLRLFTIHNVDLRKDTSYNRRGISSSPTDESRYSRSLYKEAEREDREREREGTGSFSLPIGVVKRIENRI